MRKKKFISAALVNAMVFTGTIRTDFISVRADVETKETNVLEDVATQTNVTSGACGENLTWEFKDGTLTISGSGEMDDDVPWRDFKYEIKKVIMKNGITHISESAFKYCRGLTSVEIPTSITSIGSYLFYECSGLKSIEIPTSVTSIGAYAFYGCSKIVSIKIPTGLKSIGIGAFYGCSGLKSIEMPKRMKSIGGYAFYGCSKIASFKIPTGLKSIGEYAFSECSGLRTIKIPTSVIDIGTYAFYGCSGLKSIDISTGVKSIGYGAFCDCSGLTSIKIPSSITSIGTYAFSGCSKVTSIVVDGNNTIYDSRNNCNAIIDSKSKKLIAGCKSTKIPASVTIVGVAAFYGCIGLKSIKIPTNVTSIERAAFGNCSGVMSIVVDKNNKVYDSRNNCNAIIDSKSEKLIAGCKNTKIPTGVASIGEYAFNGCIGLTSMRIPTSVKSIEGSAFGGCSGLTSIKIPVGVTNISMTAFYGCRGLKSIIVDADNKAYDSRNNCNAIINTESNTLIAVCKNTKIPTSVKSIEGSAFKGCDWLTNIEIPSSVKSIGECAFEGWSGLTNIKIPSSVESIGYCAFGDCSKLTKIKIQPGVENIGALAFYKCSGLTSIKIPAGVRKIGTEAFFLCSGLMNIEIPSSVTNIGKNVFGGCENLIIYGTYGSYAQKYAEEYGIMFVGTIHEHDYENFVIKATTGIRSNGLISKKCIECGWIEEAKNIYYACDIGLSSTNYTYNGKAKKPSVTVKDSAGKVIGSSNYTVTYSNNTNVGKATVKVVMKGNYSGTLTKTFNINKASSKIMVTGNHTKTALTKVQSFSLGAKATGGKLTYKSNSKSIKVSSTGKVTIAKNFAGKATITITASGANYKTVTRAVTISVKPAATKITGAKNLSSKKATIKWSKLSYVSGYQIQYGINSNFKGAKTESVAGGTKDSKVLSNLLIGKTYNVRVRAYKNVGGTKLYSNWSSKKTVKITK